MAKPFTALTTRLSIGFLAAGLAVGVAVANPDKPGLTEPELERRCEAALRDLRTFCGAELRPQRFQSPPARGQLLHAQQPPPAPNPGTEKPVLPRGSETMECLNARIRVDQYCYRDKKEPGGQIMSRAPSKRT